MTQDDGEWLPVADAARQVRVRPETIRVWVHRGKVRRKLIERRAYVSMVDVFEAEYAWRQRVA